MSRDALEALLTREITTDDYVRALNALAPRRARERRYKATGRAA